MRFGYVLDVYLPRGAYPAPWAESGWCLGGARVPGGGRHMAFPASFKLASKAHTRTPAHAHRAAQQPLRRHHPPPADKNNKREHRGFGFVTFETEAAIQRVVAHGPHHIRGSIVAIDSAVPRQVRAWGEGRRGGAPGQAHRRITPPARCFPSHPCPPPPPCPPACPQEEMLLALGGDAGLGAAGLGGDRDATADALHHLEQLSLESSGRGRALLRPF